MKKKEDIEADLARLVAEQGEYLYDIALPHGVWTRGERLPHTRLKRILQIIQDVVQKPLSECRILDLACLEGMFSIEFALHGASVTGIEIRKANLQKAIFVKDAYGLSNVTFVQDDVRNISIDKYGHYDVILCSGILYHLPAPDVFHFIQNIYEMVNRAVIIDTHISLSPALSVPHKGTTYYGHIYREHAEDDTTEIKEKRSIASIGNSTSFIFTRPSLVNILSDAGFSSVYECFNPPHLNFGRPGLEHQNRCTFLAIKGQNCILHTSPTANKLVETWPEKSLSYSQKSDESNRDRLKRSLWYGRRLLGKMRNGIRQTLRH